MKKKKVPKFLQPYLWSVPVGNLDADRDKVYIIHQILSYGDIAALRWLLETYHKEVIRRVFALHPKRIYLPSVFYFVKNFVLGLEHKKLTARAYVKSLR